MRHHSPVLAAAIPALLDAAAPDAVLVELPADMQPWLPWLAHPDTHAPVALAAADGDEGGPLAFYPFADFSPSWPRCGGRNVEACRPTAATCR
ncbi:DUF5682 family protein [Micromonospora sp. BRA006-A]|nr:DUF5682 family protein [Micromonospora sp. BRA006-A]